MDQQQGSAGDGVVPSAEDVQDVALCWQQWSLRTPSPERVTEAIRAASTVILRRIG